MVEAPERIWAGNAGPDLGDTWSDEPVAEWIEYLRADIAASQLAEARAERDEAKRRLFPYADAIEICGYSTTGIYLIGDRKSIDAASKAFHYSAQIEEYRTAFNQRIKAAEAEHDRLAAENAQLREALEPFGKRCDEAVRPDDSDNDGVTIKTRYLRAARAALAGKE